jgi:hypothetical protein
VEKDPRPLTRGRYAEPVPAGFAFQAWAEGVVEFRPEKV